MWSLRLGHLKSYFGRPARLARRPPSPGRLVLGWPGGVLFALFFCAFSPSSVSARIVVAFAVGALAQAITFGIRRSNHCASCKRKPTGCFWASPIRLRHNSNYNLSVVAERLAPIYEYIRQSLSQDHGSCSTTGPDRIGRNCSDQE